MKKLVHVDDFAVVSHNFLFNLDDAKSTSRDYISVDAIIYFSSNDGEVRENMTCFRNKVQKDQRYDENLEISDRMWTFIKKIVNILS